VGTRGKLARTALILVTELVLLETPKHSCQLAGFESVVSRLARR
jgi:hypothetical protein